MVTGLGSEKTRRLAVDLDGFKEDLGHEGGSFDGIQIRDLGYHLWPWGEACFWICARYCMIVKEHLGGLMPSFGCIMA